MIIMAKMMMAKCTRSVGSGDKISSTSKYEKHLVGLKGGCEGVKNDSSRLHFAAKPKTNIPKATRRRRKEMPHLAVGAVQKEMARFVNGGRLTVGGGSKGLVSNWADCPGA